MSLSLAVVALVGVVAAIAAVLSSPSLLARVMLVPWVVLALVSSEAVWAHGNNAVRVMAPLLLLGLVALVMSPDPEMGIAAGNARSHAGDLGDRADLHAAA